MAAGAVTITVQTDGGLATSRRHVHRPAAAGADLRRVAQPVQPEIRPSGTNVTLFGNNFNVGTVSVRFGTTVAAIVGTPTATQIVAAVPTMAAGAVTITVQTGGGSVTSADAFTVT